MKKILVLTSTYPTFLSGDGTPPFVHELNRRIVSSGGTVIVLCPRRPGTKMCEEQDGVNIYRYPYFFRSSREKLADGAILPNLRKNWVLYLQVPFLLLMSLWYTHKLIVKYKITSIHAHRIFMNGFIGALYKTFLNKKVRLLCTSHGSDLHSLQGGLIDFLKRWTIQRCDEVTVVSTYLKDQLDLLMGKITTAKVIPMGVDEERFHPRYYDEQLKQEYGITGEYFLFVGRLSKEKGVFDLLHVMTSLRSKYPNCTLLMVGHGPLQAELEEMVMQKGLQKHIIFVGAVPNYALPRFYATADVLLALSTKESFGLVQVEALFSGTPVITTKGLGCDDIIISGKNGFLVDVTKDERADMYVDKLFDKVLSRKVLRESVQQFSRTHIVSKYLPLL